jgi:hypothetical protein
MEREQDRSMKTRHIYVLLCIAGALIPSWQLVPWVAEHGFSLRLVTQELFANRISAFFGLDVIISAVVLVAFVLIERSRGRLRLWWAPIVATLCVGVSLGLPLALYLREVENLRS